MAYFLSRWPIIIPINCRVVILIPILTCVLVTTPLLLYSTFLGDPPWRMPNHRRRKCFSCMDEVLLILGSVTKQPMAHKITLENLIIQNNFFMDFLLTEGKRERNTHDKSLMRFRYHAANFLSAISDILTQPNSLSSDFGCLLIPFHLSLTTTLPTPQLLHSSHHNYYTPLTTALIYYKKHPWASKTIM